ncbi:MAG: L-lactate permease [Muribaculaceae bacterium]|nr:L-lactate permease [Muribaculaceae bacterium]
MALIISLLPLALLFILMLGFKMTGYKSAFFTLIITIALVFIGVPYIDILPERFAETSLSQLVLWSSIEGVLKALFPIFLIILMAIFSYNIVVESGQIEIIKKQLTSLTDDKGILVLLMVWGFGGLLEGMAGFGTAVAIPAALLIGLGFRSVFSAFVALLGNTVATGFAALGVPIITLCNEAVVGGGAPTSMINEISAFTIIQLSPLFYLIPFLILTFTDKKAWVKNIFLTLWVGTVSLFVQFISVIYIGVEAPAILGSIAAILALIVAAKFIKKEKSQILGHSFVECLRSWSVYIVILILVLLSGPLCAPINNFLKSHLISTVPLPVLENVFKFGWISNAAFILLLGSIIGGLIQGLSLKKLIKILCKTLLNLRKTALTICSLIVLASIMNYTGMINAIANSLAGITGSFYPLLAPMVGAVGTFVTGSDTSSNILFAKLQIMMADKLGMTGNLDLVGITGSESNWLLSANTTGATGGKMISPQSIAVATAACSINGEDSNILKSVLPFALIYVIIGGILVYFLS